MEESFGQAAFFRQDGVTRVPRIGRWVGPALALGLLAAGCDARLPEPDSPGARLYAARCTGCHRLYAPGR